MHPRDMGAQPWLASTQRRGVHFLPGRLVPWVYSSWILIVLCFDRTISNTLAWKIPWMEEPGGLQSMGWLTVRHDWATSLSLFTFMHWRRKWQPTPVHAWRTPGMGEPGGLPSLGSHRVGHDWSDLAAAATYYENFKTIYSDPSCLSFVDLLSCRHMTLLYMLELWPT